MAGVDVCGVVFAEEVLEERERTRGWESRLFILVVELQRWFGRYLVV